MKIVEKTFKMMLFIMVLSFLMGCGKENTEEFIPEVENITEAPDTDVDVDEPLQEDIEDTVTIVADDTVQPEIDEVPAEPEKVSYSLEELEEVYTTEAVKIRTAPSTDSDVYEVASAHTQVYRIADDGEWSRVYIKECVYYI